MPVSGSPKEIIHSELHRFKHGQLHSGSHKGPIVKNRKQAIAIALSESRKGGRLHRDMGGLIPGMSFPPMPSQSADQSTPAPPQPFPNPPAMSGAAPTAGLGNAVFPPSPNAPPPPPANPLAMSGFGAGMAPPPAMGSMPPSPPATQIAPIPSAPPAIGNSAGNGSRIDPTFGALHRQFGGGMTRSPNPNWMVRNEARSMLHSGPISSIVPGRTDRHNVSVKSGSYVMPADAVSHLGQNNTKAGQAILGHMFGGQGPYGAGKDMAMRHGPGAPKPPAMQKTAMPHMPKFQSAGGGKGDHPGEPVPIVVAGGEFTIPTEAVAAVGGGDIKRGHKILDQWVLSIRKKHIATLKGLPPPAKA